jgi:hypothetical protein
MHDSKQVHIGKVKDLGDVRRLSSKDLLRCLPQGDSKNKLTSGLVANCLVVRQRIHHTISGTLQCNEAVLSKFLVFMIRFTEP